MFTGPVETFINVFLGGLIVIAVITVLVQKSSQTPQVLNSAGGALSSSLFAAQGKQ
jgi:preprotein translocase subunit SecG